MHVDIVIFRKKFATFNRFYVAFNRLLFLSISTTVYLYVFCMVATLLLYFLSCSTFRPSYHNTETVTRVIAVFATNGCRLFLYATVCFDTLVFFYKISLLALLRSHFWIGPFIVSLCDFSVSEFHYPCTYVHGRALVVAWCF